MTQVKLDKAVAEDLITSKMRILQEYINSILKRWNETSTKLFLDINFDLWNNTPDIREIL